MRRKGVLQIIFGVRTFSLSAGEPVRHSSRVTESSHSIALRGLLPRE
jgi:hypothetical protein